MIALRAVALAGLIGVSSASSQAAVPPTDSAEAKSQAQHLNSLPPLPPAGPGHIDHSGRTQKGRGSFYAKKFTNRKMADGHRMNPNANIAASKTLPLGSVAKVKNLDNGKTATVKIEDRGPYVDGRVVDLAPKVADDLDMKTKGVTPVEVKPITIPEPDGGVKLGSGAAESNQQEIKDATAVTRELTAPKSVEAAER
nr:septal ring lytic transglycosylase RlpA family protein [uncultured Rhodopila sp.]